ncbi:MAG: LysM peptidoglycan-binding domain-containing protein [Planctomycetota bacterium]
MNDQDAAPGRVTRQRPDLSMRPVTERQGDTVSPGRSAMANLPGASTRIEPENPRRETTEQFPAQRPVNPVFDSARNQVAPVTTPVTQTQPQYIAPKQPAAKAPEVRVGGSYTVVSGDSLERIARRQLGDAGRWGEIQRLNGIENPKAIRVGQVLRLPEGAPAAKVNQAAETPAPSTRPTSGAAGTYTVQSGDVLSRIAQKQLGSAKRYTEILALNPGLKPEKLYVGQVLQMPGGSAPATTGQPVATRTSKSADKRFVVQ